MPDGLSDPSSRILVTGGGGFVGRWLLRALDERLPADARIVATSRAVPSGIPPGRATFLPLDVTDRDAVRALVGDLRPTGIVHLAAIASVPEAQRDARFAWAVNLGGTMNLAEAVRDLSPAARLVFAGTSEAYGGTFKARGAPLDEDAPLDPANTYAATKAAADLLLGQMSRDGLRAIRMRPFNHTGPGQAESYVVPAFAAQVARIEAGRQAPVLRVGNLDARRDFLDVRDVVDGYLAALAAADLAPGEIVNLASGVPRRVGDILDLLLAEASCPIAVEPDPARMRPSDTPLAVGSAERARRRLGWSPRIPFERTLSDILRAVRGEAGGVG